ncbi:hypothetical protein [Methanonatronarchaeum sp. AMET-Sl]|uniref:hypothetical protein n=1 Tax=Methanonatronarchaeum sp. AMET-Sl TaxID=3037654 RepID=UPI00244E1F7C|nr:hypothetical protein [Methanonatronarchaeum sp. AMET-Sl]WGI17141.1 hypothetical protein QEN48_06475 [Methanonatronarchaeum sp. AMET-Sl]
MYLVEIKQSAIENNEDVKEYVYQNGRTISFDSKKETEELVDELTENQENICLQKSAPQDRNKLDEYIIHFPKQYKYKPKKDSGNEFVFELTGNQIGAIGESIVYGHYILAPALKHYLSKKHEFEYDTRTISAPKLLIEESFYTSKLSWMPDLAFKLTEKKGK